MIHAPQTGSLVVRYVATRSIPFIQLYALYVLCHGEDGPGGGFQAGVLFASAYVLQGLVHGWKAGRAGMPQGVSDTLNPTGALLYGAIGLGAVLLGGAFLQYEAYAPEHAHAAHHFGLIGIEIGVTITVAAAMVTLFFEMARPQLFLDDRSRSRRSADETSGD